MSARTLVSYDDIVQGGPSGNNGSGGSAPPRKRRRNNNNNNNNNNNTNTNNSQRQYRQHWDNPGPLAESIPYGSSSSSNIAPALEVTMQVEEEEGEEESRMLTHEEIWDDSALVDAWESAQAEYEAFHGKGKSWKDEPVKKSPLWYNVPPKPPKGAATTTTTTTATSTSNVHNSNVHNGAPATVPAPGTDAENSQPVNFDTFVPAHDPSLFVSSAPAELSTFADGPWPTRDEAFSRALGAMYWAGYWTAVYHVGLSCPASHS
ncbi:hypothetical protein OF83DRAFT_1097073 [Amylostereum chailletii]|nr:hypothetical protein OF83DRAFT_1097073 [Amylostereum chailletii]